MVMDVLILGGGFAGFTTALSLTKFAPAGQVPNITVIEIASEARTAIMCSESQPLTKHKIPRANCHRVGMLAPLLRTKVTLSELHFYS